MGSPVGSPAASRRPILRRPLPPKAEATPNPTRSDPDYEAGYDNYETSVFGIAHLSRCDYVRSGRHVQRSPAQKIEG